MYLWKYRTCIVQSAISTFSIIINDFFINFQLQQLFQGSRLCSVRVKVLYLDVRHRQCSTLYLAAPCLKTFHLPDIDYGLFRKLECWRKTQQVKPDIAQHRDHRHQLHSLSLSILNILHILAKAMESYVLQRLCLRHPWFSSTHGQELHKLLLCLQWNTLSHGKSKVKR